MARHRAARPARCEWSWREAAPAVISIRASPWRASCSARVPDAVVSFAGTANGIEARVVPREGFELDVIRSGGLKGKSVTDRGRAASALLPARRRRTRGACSRDAGRIS